MELRIQQFSTLYISVIQPSGSLAVIGHWSIKKNTLSPQLATSKDPGPHGDGPKGYRVRVGCGGGGGTFLHPAGCKAARLPATQTVGKLSVHLLSLLPPCPPDHLLSS